ncbi:MAG: 2-aminoethylphosphonate--pyruvate transaminase [Verrucomicrobia bacterium]|nr:MAG: 2-aminoethylphosphonate--pyruvate transaminase [Verrucomicrobiota bacterium]
MKDPLLFTPGPSTTSATVKAAMQRDIGSRDADFIELVAGIRSELLRIAGVSRERGYDAVLMQGSGTFGLESVISSVIPREGRFVVLANGAYGERMATIAERLGISARLARWPENESPQPADVQRLLAEEPGATHVAMVHCETTTGILNPIDEIARIVKSTDREFIVDAMSSFGGVPLDLSKLEIDYLISSPNKCLEGVPGFSCVLARRTALEATKGRARSVSLDLLAQWEGLQRNGQFRFTPPTHALLAFARALEELREEGGVFARAARYRASHETLRTGMRRLGFAEYLPAERQSNIITAFRYPDDPSFRFEDFYRRLRARGFLIYPGKLSQGDCFRIGTIGRINEDDMGDLVAVIGEVLDEIRP